jgi:hypothetical protein
VPARTVVDRSLDLAVASLLICFSTACELDVPLQVNYSVRPIAIAPLGSKVTDESRAFAETFCATLPHTDGGIWGDCATYLETRVPSQGSVTSMPVPQLRVMIVGGAFTHCFENQGIFAFNNSIDHLKSHAVAFGPRVSIGGTDTTEANAERIAQYLNDNPGEYIAIGHSKGAADLMTAIQHHPAAQQRIKVLISIAGAIGGTRLSHGGASAGALGFRAVILSAGLGDCNIKDNGGIASLRRDVRYQALRDWNPPQTLRTYSLVAVSSREQTSGPLRGLWRLNAFYSIDQDSHIIAEEAIIPGSAFLGVAKGDHWAVALPMSEHPATAGPVNRNRFPRTALLEALIRHVTR